MDLNQGGSVIVGFNRFDKQRSSGFVWTPERGLVNAQVFFEEIGMDLPDSFVITALTGVSQDGSVLTGYGLDQRRSWPFQTRSFRVQIDAKALDLAEGDAVLRVTARDWSWRGSLTGNEVELEGKPSG